MVGPRMHAHRRTYHSLIRRAKTTTEDEGMYAGRSSRALRVQCYISHHRHRNAGVPRRRALLFLHSRILVRLTLHPLTSPATHHG